MFYDERQNSAPIQIQRPSGPLQRDLRKTRPIERRMPSEPIPRPTIKADWHSSPTVRDVSLADLVANAYEDAHAYMLALEDTRLMLDGPWPFWEAFPAEPLHYRVRLLGDIRRAFRGLMPYRAEVGHMAHEDNALADVVKWLEDAARVHGIAIDRHTIMDYETTPNWDRVVENVRTYR